MDIDEKVVENILEELVTKVCMEKRVKQEKKLKKKDTKSGLKTSVKQDKHFDSEYYSLPPIEKLCISVEENAKMEKFGLVESQIDFIVKIKPFDNAPHLGYDTILFDSERNPLGEIFEIFGTVTNTMYAVRFNSREEAAEKMPIGKELFYAFDEKITKTVFPNELAKLKHWERSRQDESDSDVVFSDDEAEQQYLVKKRQKNRDRTVSQATVSGCSAKKKTRTDFRGGNPFSPHHKQWRRNQTYHNNQHNHQSSYQHSVSPFYGQLTYNRFPISDQSQHSYIHQHSRQPIYPQFSIQNHMPSYDPRFSNYFYPQQISQSIPFQLYPPPPPPPLDPQQNIPR